MNRCRLECPGEGDVPVTEIDDSTNRCAQEFVAVLGFDQPCRQAARELIGIADTVISDETVFSKITG